MNWNDWIILIISILSLVAACFSCAIALLIYKRQRNNAFNDYILNDFLVPFSTLESDLMLLLDGTNNNLTKSCIDTMFIEMLCKAKSYARILKYDSLLEYADFELSNPDAKTGKLIEDYFDVRKEYLDKLGKNDKNARKYLLERKTDLQARIRFIRDEIVSKFCK